MPEYTLKPQRVFGFLRNGAVLALVLVLGACTGPGLKIGQAGDNNFINSESKFSVAQFGVAASPRVSNARDVPKGGGRAVVGKPYRIAGKWYYPQVDNSYNKTGAASWYGPNFQGRLTANGEIFDQYALSAAHPTLPLPSYVRVKNLSNGRSVIVRVNDRGPFANDRIIDLSRRTAEVLDFINKGTARVQVTYIGRAPLEGDDTRYLVASINNNGAANPPLANPGSQFRVPSVISRQNGGIFGAVINLFSYAGSNAGDAIVSDAHAAATAMANQVPALDAWKLGVQGEILSQPFYLGTYSNLPYAAELARQFALLGAITPTMLNEPRVGQIRLDITALKPGVTSADIEALVLSLGLQIPQG